MSIRLICRKLALAAILLCSSMVVAATPSVMSYQGLLSDSGGLPASGAFSIQFTIYDDAVLSAPVNIKWQESHPAVSVVDGLFSVLLGAGAPAVPLLDGVFDGTQRYLGIKVGADPEISPRIRLGTSPYSYRVSTIDGSRGGDVFDSIRIVTPGGLTALELFVRLDTTAIKFYEPVSVIPPLRMDSQPLLTELSDTALLMFPHGGLAQPVDTNISITSDGKIRAVSTIAIGTQTAATGFSSAAFGAVDTASGNLSFVAGGQNNAARGDFSFAAGRNAKANHDGSFVWADNALTSYSSTVGNSFNIRAGNGLVLSSPAGPTKNISIGEHYRDNGIVAWARVEDNGSTGPGQFGLSFVGRDAAGIYTIVTDALASSPLELVPMACVEVDAPPTNPLAARLIYVDQINNNTFKVYITDGNYSPVDNVFVFMVTAR